MDRAVPENVTGIWIPLSMEQTHRVSSGEVVRVDITEDNGGPMVVFVKGWTPSSDTQPIRGR